MTHPLPSIQQAVGAFLEDFDFGEGGNRTHLSYRSGARALLRFFKESEGLDPQMSIGMLPSSISADFKSWLQGTAHAGPGRQSDEEKPVNRSYSAATVKLYQQALSRLLRFWWYREWLSFSPEEETEARKALQIQRSRGQRERTQTRSPDVPADFGDRMLEAVSELPLPTVVELPDPAQRRKVRLENMRSKSLIHTLRASALRASDICGLTRSQIELAKHNNGYMAITMRKTGLLAHVVLGQNTLESIYAYKGKER